MFSLFSSNLNQCPEAQNNQVFSYVIKNGPGKFAFVLSVAFALLAFLLKQEYPVPCMVPVGTEILGEGGGVTL